MDKDLPNKKEELNNLPQQPEAMYQELNLLRVEGYAFSFDPKATGKNGEVFEFNEYFDNLEENIRKRPVTIVPHPMYGRPSPLSYKLLNVIFKKLSEYGLAIPHSVPFTFRELARKAGRSYGGRDAKEIYNALKQLRNTEITLWVFDKAENPKGKPQRWMNYSFSIFQTIAASGSGNTFEAGYVTIDPLIIRNLQNNYHRTLNYNRMNLFQASSISLALYKQIYNVFSTRTSHKQPATFEKNYDKICTEWLGGLKIQKHKSRIIQQLGPHLDHLKSVKLLRSFKIEKNSTGGWKFIFSPAIGFRQDYENFYKKSKQNDIQFQYDADKTNIQDPLDLVSFFYKKLHNNPELDDRIYSPKETEFAKTVLENISLLEAKDFVEYAIAEATTTNFDIKTFGGVKQYLPGWPEAKIKMAKEEQKLLHQKKKEKEEWLKDKYQNYREEELVKIRSSFSESELKKLESSIEEEIKKEQPGSIIGLPLLVRVQLNKFFSEQNNLPDYDTWRKENGLD